VQNPVGGAFGYRFSPTMEMLLGVGELPLTSPHVAVVSAIHQATGVHVRHLPARPEKVLAAMNGGNGKHQSRKTLVTSSF
jgi:hypothetical protein